VGVTDIELVHWFLQLKLTAYIEHWMLVYHQFLVQHLMIIHLLIT